MKQIGRKRERILMVAVSLIIAVMFFQFYSNISGALQETDDAHKSNSCVQLSSGFDTKVMRDILHHGEYFMDTEYEHFVVKELSDKMNKVKRINNLGQLNKRPFLVEATQMAIRGGDFGKARYMASAAKLGLDSLLVTQMDSLCKYLPYSVDVTNKESGIVISGKVSRKGEKVSIIDRLLRRSHAKPVPNVLVRLTEEITSQQKENLVNMFLSEIARKQKDTTLTATQSREALEELFRTNLDTIGQSTKYYVRTDSEGQFTFNNLEKGKNYAVIPVAKGKEYGRLKGVPQIQESTTFDFTEKTHTLALFDRSSYKRMKADKIFTVRSADEFKKNLRATLFFFLLAFWLFHLAMTVRKKAFDEYLLPLLMLVIGLGLVVLYAIQEPLYDMDYTSGTVLLLLAVMVFFSFLIFVLNDKWLLNIVNFRIENVPPISILARKYGWLNKQTRGYEWLILSGLLMIALLALGTGPEGSGVKVNLFGVQVSELSKYLMIIFFAKYFTANTPYFRNIPNNIWLLRNSLAMLIGFAMLIGVYAVLGDLGPALVLCLTFLVFYAFAKGEFPQMILTALVFAISLYLVTLLIGGDVKSLSESLSIYAAIVILGLGVYAFITRKNESMFFIVTIISSFIFLENLSFSFARRLADRNSMFRNLWDNSLHGGDQVAQGIWSIDSGGLTGQGLGNGFSNVMPAYHTDMIFESIGEELGILSLIALLILFGLMFYRSMLIARRTGQPLLFYLINGIAIATLVQLSIIVGGSLGLIPLTGISVPFLSKGNSSLLINIFFFIGIIVLSQIRGKSIQMKQIKEKFDDMNLYVLLTFMGIILVFSTTLMKYWFTRDIDMIRPAKVLTKQGEWMHFHNPRINIVERELKPGNIYDRNGVLLATSERSEFLKLADKDFGKLHIDAKTYNKQKNSRLKRYYPYGEDLIYLLGDWNTALVTNPNLGYVADYRLLSDLRGFEHKKTTASSVQSEHFREAPYLPKEEKTSVLKSYDYSDYLSYLQNGVDSTSVGKYKKEKRKDVYLTIDVKMNQIINKAIRESFIKTYSVTEANKTVRKTINLNTLKISVVAINAATGEVLASAMNPQPNKQDILKLNQIPKKYYSLLFRSYFGYEGMVADRDLGIFHRTIPGSTIKVVNALAYLGRAGADSVSVRYNVTKPEAILGSNQGNYTLIDAIVRSSNVYFIRLVNEKELHPELFALHQSVGVNLFDKGGYYINPGTNYDEAEITRHWTEGIMVDKGINYNNPRYLGTRRRYLQSHYSFMAWGQEPVKATPLQMARLYGAIAMDGKLLPLNFVKTKGQSIAMDTEATMLVKENSRVNAKAVADTIEYAMKLQSKKYSNALGVRLYGKTGSSEREQYHYNAKIGKIEAKGKTGKVTDGWYVCYVKDTKIGHPLAFAIRIEGMPHRAGASRNAVDIWKKIAERLKNDYFITKK